MFGFRKLDVYKCALEALPIAYKFADLADAETKRQLKRAALSINLNIAEGSGRSGDDQRQFYRIARGSALESGAVLDAIVALGLVEMAQITRLENLLVRIVSMLTRMS
jgi:four helix bundle protein